MMQNDQDLFDKNLLFFEAAQPALYQRLRDHAPLSKIICDEDGEPDILFEGMRLYNTGATKYCNKQIERFWQRPDRLLVNPISSENVDDIGQKPLFNMLKYADAAGITFSVERTTDKAFHLFFLGVGLGQHILPMVERVQPRNVVFIEPNFEFLYQSMFTFDWSDLANQLAKEKAQMHFLTSQSKDVLISDLKALFRLTGPVSFDGLTVFRHYDSPLMSAIMLYLKDHGDMLLTGLGFFADELNIVANGYSNLKSGKERIFHASTSPKNVPVFVVGSGPSLDMALDSIRKNQEKAIIISCGTGLGPLVKSGITPDIHMELERGHFQVTMPQFASKFCDLSKLLLVASTTIQDKTREMFPNRVLFFRHILSSFSVFSNNLYHCLRHPFPTVGNAGVSFAQDMGFREIYFFGLDMGFKDGKDHHSKVSVYEESSVVSEFEHHSDRVSPGNFGGEIKGAFVFDWAKETVQQSMRNSAQGVRYYNCSDGSMIRGATPLLPDQISLPEMETPKAVFLENLVKSYPVYTKEKFDEHWANGKLIEDIKRSGEILCAAIDKHQDLTDKKYISALSKICEPESYDKPHRMILRGSLFMMVVAVEYYLDRILDKDKLDGFVEAARNALKSTIYTMCEVAESEFRHLQDHGSLNEWKDR